VFVASSGSWLHTVFTSYCLTVLKTLCCAGKGGPDIMVVTATAAVGGLVALTGSLLSYAVARARGSRRERKLKGGCQNSAAQPAQSVPAGPALASTLSY
jgi:hypothetical protein